MVNDSSLGGGPAHFTFDLDTQKGIMHLLASVRASGLTPEERNELRDLIFLYMNGGKDQSLRITLEQKITQYQVTPVSVTEPATPVTEPAPVRDFGASRPAPSFSAASIKPAESSVNPSATTPQSTVASTPASSPAQTVQPVSPPSQVAPTPTAQPLPTSPPASTTPLPPVTPPVQPVPPPTTESIPAPINGDNLARIKEIKSQVNEKIGNPVNLVDIDNAVGREYMAAMLDAMKQVSAGGAAVTAMKRLEEAYLLVERTVSEHNSQQAEAPVAPAETSVAELTPAESVPVESPVETIPTPVEPLSYPSPSPEPITVSVESSDTVEQAPIKPAFSQAEEIEAPVVNIAQPETNVTKAAEQEPSEPVPTVSDSLAAQFSKNTAAETTSSTLGVETRWDNESQPIRPLAQPVGQAAQPPLREAVEQKPATETVNKLASLAQAKNKLRSPDDLPAASSLETSSIQGDPLFTKEVDEGLNQLLSEWPIFKKSGLFGTGPKGREHPLFKKIAGLQIPLLLAGRFEGATQEIKQSITDYMNGWRYEQGIIYQQGENFEHYLRRVIRHILDLQKAKGSS
ncbi:hypothetical protein KC851_01380 [Candidatus Kaiserbacteria bacterium]|nr:hypothetical protein [Candidatus Kaiserbacteria bacterium]